MWKFELNWSSKLRLATSICEIIIMKEKKTAVSHKLCAFRWLEFQSLSLGLEFNSNILVRHIIFFLQKLRKFSRGCFVLSSAFNCSLPNKLLCWHFLGSKYQLCTVPLRCLNQSSPSSSSVASYQRLNDV